MRPGNDRETAMTTVRPAEVCRQLLAALDGNRKFRADVPYFHRLCELGREAGQAWLAEKLPSVAPSNR